MGWMNTSPMPSSLFADGDRHPDVRHISHGHLERLVQQGERLLVAGCIRNRIVPPRIAGMGEQAGRGLIGNLDPEGTARVGTAVTGPRVFSYVKLSAAPEVDGHEPQEHIETAQLKGTE